MNIKKTIEWMDIKETPPEFGQYGLFALDDGTVISGSIYINYFGHPFIDTGLYEEHQIITNWAFWPDSPLSEEF